MNYRRLVVLVFLLFCFYSCKSPSSNNNGNGGETPTNFEDPQSQGTTFWWNDTVFYEIFVRSFYDSDGDGVGDINGLIEKLDYLNDGDPATSTDLGITGIWLMPVCQSPSYHGYDVIDYRTIETDYGTNADFLRFVAAAKQRGIKIIVDLVLNHTSSQHPWFIASAQSDVTYVNWYRWSIDQPTYTGPWGQQVWHSHSNGRYYYGLFWGGMPDLNYQEPAVYNEIKDTARFWLQDLQVDGFRLDAVKYIIEEGTVLEDVQATYDFWRRFQQDARQAKPGMMSVGEAWDDTGTVVNYVTEGDLDVCFEFNLATTILNAVGSAGPSIVVSKMREIKTSYPYHRYGVFLTNHDQDRVMTNLGENPANARLAASIYLTLPGVPFIYYGEEIGMRGSGAHENIRRPMQWDSSPHAGFTSGVPWNTVDNNYTTVNVGQQITDPQSSWNRYRHLIFLRGQYNALDRGTYQAIHASNSWIYAYLRQYNHEVVLVMHNFSSQAMDDVGVDILSSNVPEGNYTATELLRGSAAAGLSVDSNGGFTQWIPLPRLEAKETYLIKLH